MPPCCLVGHSRGFFFIITLHFIITSPTISQAHISQAHISQAQQYLLINMWFFLQPNTIFYYQTPSSPPPPNNIYLSLTKGTVVVAFVSFLPSDIMIRLFIFNPPPLQYLLLISYEKYNTTKVIWHSSYPQNLQHSYWYYSAGSNNCLTVLSELSTVTTFLLRQYPKNKLVDKAGDAQVNPHLVICI